MTSSFTRNSPHDFTCLEYERGDDAFFFQAHSHFRHLASGKSYHDFPFLIVQFTHDQLCSNYWNCAKRH